MEPSGHWLICKFHNPDVPTQPLIGAETREVLINLPGLVIERWDLAQYEVEMVRDRAHIIDVIEEGYAAIPEPPNVGVASANMTLDEAVHWHGVQKLYDQGATGNGVKVAILDTGISPSMYDKYRSRIDYAGSTLTGEGYEDVGSSAGHGTFCADAVATMAPSARLVVIKVLSSETGSGYTSGIITGMEKARELGCNIISMSLGGPGEPSDAMCLAADRLSDLGMVICAAAGNEQRGKSDWQANISHPGCARGSVCIGAVDSARAIASFSNWGDVLDLAALGVGISEEGRIWNGTSMATPIAAGIAACVQSARGFRPKVNVGTGEVSPSTKPFMSSQEVKTILYGGAINTGLEVWQEGAGVVDGDGILNKMGEAPVHPPAPFDEGYYQDYYPDLPRVSLTKYVAGDRREAVHTLRKNDIGHFTPKPDDDQGA